MNLVPDLVPGSGAPDDAGLLSEGSFPGEWAWSADALAARRPGSELAWELESGDPDRSSDQSLVEAVVAFRRVAAWAEAGAARAAAALSRRAVMNPAWPPLAGQVSVPDATAEELAPALGCSRRAARRLVTDGRAFEGGLAATGEALARGAIDVPRARVLVDALADQPVEVAWVVQDAVLPQAPGRTCSQLSRDVARALIVADPAGATERCRAAAERRRVDRPKPLADGMAGWWAVLPAAEAVRMDTALDALARSGRAAGDCRTMDQLRADLLADLVLGRIACCGASRACDGSRGGDDSHGGDSCTYVDSRAGESCEGDGSHRPRRASARARIDVLVPWEVLAGLSEEPGFLAGYGPIPAPVARDLAADATWRRILTDPPSGAVLDVGRTRYRPPAALAEHVRARDRWCVRPGCSARADACDLDHTAEWDRDEGPTAHDNLGPLCRRDHQVKTHGGARLRQVAPGVFEWTTPLGRTYRVEPGRDGAYRRVDGLGLDPPPF